MHALHNYYGVLILYTFLNMSQPSVVCLDSLRSADVGIVGVISAGVGIAGVRSASVGRRSREARRRRAFLLVIYYVSKLCWQQTSPTCGCYVQDIAISVTNNCSGFANILDRCSSLLLGVTNSMVQLHE